MRVVLLEWIEALSNPEPVLAVYGDAVPELGEVRIEEIILSVNGPTLRLRFDLPDLPVNLPVKWRRDGLDVVQIEISLGGLRVISIEKFTTDSLCDLKIRKDGVVSFSGESESVKFRGVADAATIVRVSAYAMVCV